VGPSRFPFSPPRTIQSTGRRPAIRAASRRCPPRDYDPHSGLLVGISNDSRNLRRGCVGCPAHRSDLTRSGNMLDRYTLRQAVSLKAWPRSRCSVSSAITHDDVLLDLGCDHVTRARLVRPRCGAADRGDADALRSTTPGVRERTQAGGPSGHLPTAAWRWSASSCLSRRSAAGGAALLLVVAALSVVGGVLLAPLAWRI